MNIAIYYITIYDYYIIRLIKCQLQALKSRTGTCLASNEKLNGKFMAKNDA
jgi:hypothetical protein